MGGESAGAARPGGGVGPLRVVGAGRFPNVCALGGRGVGHRGVHGAGVAAGRSSARTPRGDLRGVRRESDLVLEGAHPRVATDDTQAELCELAERTPAGRLSTAVAAWLAGREEPAETEERHQRARSLSLRTEPDGMVVGSFRLPPLPAAELIAAVDAWVMRRPAPSNAERGGHASVDASTSPGVTGPEVGSRWPSVAQQRADALVALVTGGGAGVVAEVVVHVRGDGCALDDGTPVADSLVERIAPASFMRALIHDAQRRPIDASGRHRHPTARQRRVVLERDRACVGCGDTGFLECDHDPPFEVTRRTIVDELAPRCRTCHRARHRGTR